MDKLSTNLQDRGDHYHLTIPQSADVWRWALLSLRAGPTDLTLHLSGLEVARVTLPADATCAGAQARYSGATHELTVRIPKRRAEISIPIVRED